MSPNPDSVWEGRFHAWERSVACHAVRVAFSCLVLTVRAILVVTGWSSERDSVALGRTDRSMHFSQAINPHR